MTRFPEARARPASAPELRPQRGAAIRAILAVADPGAMGALLQAALHAGGFQVIATADAAAAAAFMGESPVDLVIVDVEASHLDGFALVDRIRRDPRHTDMPILALATVSCSARPARARPAGWVVKPVSVAKLLAAIRRLEKGG